MLKEYMTVGKCGVYETVEKKSRFIATVCHVTTPEEAQNFINSVKNDYIGASHTVYAYSTEQPVFMQKYYDDGEPGGTAGLPVMEAIKKNRLTNICVTVTRYFGGILLGASGLVRAYGKSAYKGIEAAGVVKMTPHIPVGITVEYGDYGKIENYINVNGLTKEETAFKSDVEIDLILPEEKTEYIAIQLTELTSGRILITKKAAVYRAVNL